MYTITAESEFDSAHFLSGYDGKCRNIHGHHWIIEAEIYGEKLRESGQHKGMIVDFGDLKRALNDIADRFDHCLIYEKGTLRATTEAALLSEGFRLAAVTFRPTAENLAKFFFGEMKGKGYKVSRVTVYETPTNRASYSE